MVLMPKRITLYFPSLTGGGSQNLNDGNSIICFSFFFSAPSLIDVGQLKKLAEHTSIVREDLLPSSHLSKCSWSPRPPGSPACSGAWSWWCPGGRGRRPPPSQQGRQRRGRWGNSPLSFWRGLISRVYVVVSLHSVREIRTVWLLRYLQVDCQQSTTQVSQHLQCDLSTIKTEVSEHSFRAL